MTVTPEVDSESLEIARQWCALKGQGWSVGAQLGKGGTAPVFEISSPDGRRALKIYDMAFSSGQKGEIEQKRIDQQIALGNHSCASLVRVYEGGKFSERLYVLMSRAPGRELETCLASVPRHKIRHIVDQVARAAIFLKSKELCHRDIKAANIFISHDFEQVTLLDISVIRNVHDPVGLGTDHDGQLPVLATARYSPPEYLFRLVEPGPKLWHALTVYQLGALLHDLVMKRPLFEAEYLKSAENRYRFAWMVATVSPRVQADDVDQDLVLTARRALDKDWERRSVLNLEDFLADANVHQAHALQFLGLARAHGDLRQDDGLAVRLQRIRDICSSLQDSVLQYLRKNGVTAKHENTAGASDSGRLLVFRWDTPAEGSGTIRNVEFQVSAELHVVPSGRSISFAAKLYVVTEGSKREANMSLPEVPDEPGIESVLGSQAQSAFSKLAVDITRADSGPGIGVSNVTVVGAKRATG